MYTYTVKIGWFKKYKNVKGHTFLGDTPQSKIMMLILEDERRVFVPITDKCIEFSDGWFKQLLEQTQKEAQGQAVINHGLKNE